MKASLITLCVTTIVFASSVAMAIEMYYVAKPMIGTPVHAENKNMDWDKSTVGKTSLTDLTAR